ncbi:MAG TPA: hypothetical protein VIV59_14710, partial [Anaeromyxobacteraceae bacterium]
DRADRGASLLLLMWPAVVVLFFSIPQSKIAGYVLPALPPLAMLLGAWWDRALRRVEGQGRRLSLLVSGWIMVAFAAFLIIAPRLVAPSLSLSPTAVWMLTVTGLATLLPAGLVLYGHRSGHLGLMLGGHVAFAALFGAGAILTVPSLVRDGTQALAERIRPLLQDGDRVVCYRKYFYDLPVHLGRREPLLVVDDWDDPAIAGKDNWRRELWLGLRWRPEAAAWMVKPERFRTLCGAGSRCFVVVRRADAAELEPLALVPLGEAGDKLLFATRAAAPPHVAAP